MGQVWGWGYGGEGQLGLGSRIRMVSSPHPVSCFEPGKEKSQAPVVKAIACGGRHSAVVTGQQLTNFSRSNPSDRHRSEHLTIFSNLLHLLFDVSHIRNQMMQIFFKVL